MDGTRAKVEVKKKKRRGFQLSKKGGGLEEGVSSAGRKKCWVETDF